MSAQDVKAVMKAIASVNRVALSDARIEADAATYEGYLQAMKNIERVALPLEAEPIPVVVLRPERRPA